MTHEKHADTRILAHDVAHQRTVEEIAEDQLINISGAKLGSGGVAVNLASGRTVLTAFDGPHDVDVTVDTGDL